MAAWYASSPSERGERFHDCDGEKDQNRSEHRDSPQRTLIAPRAASRAANRSNAVDWSQAMKS